ncbi:UNVERIFIED_CONTAM: Acyl-CoA-binding domain-containing protein 2 [Sesamum angustifolium]|uniref:Acyl-CoA-binding domain-containing protein 2 n=1 Tax=Sesamum angustifolium TaxID=2727405 RepID=A0AAW2LIJ0_9LAMI
MLVSVYTQGVKGSIGVNYGTEADNLPPPSKTLHDALTGESLDSDIKISTPHSLGILSNSSPPSMGKFRQGYDAYILKPLLNFLRATNSPFVINPYPFFASSDDNLDYALFRPTLGVVDGNTNLTYTNMLDGQLDAVFSAIKRLGFTDINIVIGETGWPSRGDIGQTGVDLESAAEYNRKLIQHVTSGIGTPLMPNTTFETYIFALFNEDLKPGPTCERNFGLFDPNLTPVYDVGILKPVANAAKRIQHGVSDTYLAFYLLERTSESRVRILRNPIRDGSVDSSTSSLEEKEPLISGDGRSSNESLGLGDDSDSDDDWEGVESTELDETFSAATAFVAATAVDRAALKVSNDVQLQLYGLYKIATEGPCSAPQPSALKMTARAKWQAWHKLGAMPPEEAMEKYIDIVTELYPTWAAGSGTKKEDERSSDAPNAGSKGPMGPVFSSFMYEEESGSELGQEKDEVWKEEDKLPISTLFYISCFIFSAGNWMLFTHFAREGDEEKLLKCIESGVPLDLKDSEGRTPLHWAVDRGHMNITALLLNKNADVNAKDDEGQTALHYAAVCERTAIAELLVEHVLT